MVSDEALELAIHRALRAEVPPCVRAIIAEELSPSSVVLHVFHYGPSSSLADFAEVVETELAEVLPSSLSVAPRLNCEFLPAETFQVSPGQVIVQNNPWAAA